MLCCPSLCLTRLRPEGLESLGISFDLDGVKKPSLFTVDGAGNCQPRDTCQTAGGRAPPR